ncbi:MAG: formylglycine-generating enzyme family protein [Magnetococcus sp. YQC-3]
MLPKFAAKGTHTNSVGMEFILVPAGSFMMGADIHFDGDAKDAELPQRSVSISRPFYLGKFPVTQQDWVSVMGSNPSNHKGRTLPVERVSWDDAQAFIQALNAKEKTRAYRLPTESEWEYAARAGTNTNRYWGDGADDAAEYAWFNSMEGGKKRSSHPVGLLRPNAWGLHDMLGNLHEWCQDWFDKEYYAGGPAVDPKGPSQGSARVLRGGSWYDGVDAIRSAFRFSLPPEQCSTNIGFRVLMVKNP